jgi:LacI family repressor for deo operon, udp, cdd, tsx, nupC, and nupG
LTVKRTKQTEPASQRNPTMADIARLAGVSASTVSRALAGLPPITEETRQRVERAARDAGYAVNRHARSLRLQRSGVMLVLIPDLANPEFPDLLMHIDRAAFECGYDIMITHTAIDPGRSDRFVDELLAGGIDGVLLTSDYCPPRLLERLDAGVRLPIVRTLSPGSVSHGIASVQIDEVAAAFDVVSHLIEAGYRKIMHLGGPEQEVVAIARRKGWRNALQAHGLPHEETQVLHGGFLVEDGRHAADVLVTRTSLPEAIFCSNDEAPYGLIAGLKEHGLRVPDDIAVAGFDDLAFSRVLDPPLTTVRLPRREMAEASVRLLKTPIESNATGADEILPHELIIRRSTQPALK